MSREALVRPERLRRSKAEATSAPTSACSPASRTTPASARRLGSTDPSLVGSSSLVAQADSSAQLGEASAALARSETSEIVPERNCCVALPLAQDQQKYREGPALRDRGSLATACPSLNRRTAATPRSRPSQAGGALVETLGDGALAAGGDLRGLLRARTFASEPSAWSL